MPSRFSFSVTSQVGITGGPSHLIGAAVGGFSICDGRDIAGTVIALSQFDACNDITSPAPEFPGGVATMCCSGTVTPRQMMAMKANSVCEAPRIQIAATPPLPGITGMGHRPLKRTV